RVVGEVDLEDVQPAVDGIYEAELPGQGMQGADAAVARAAKEPGPAYRSARDMPPPEMAMKDQKYRRRGGPGPIRATVPVRVWARGTPGTVRYRGRHHNVAFLAAFFKEELVTPGNTSAKAHGRIACRMPVRTLTATGETRGWTRRLRERGRRQRWTWFPSR